MLEASDRPILDASSAGDSMLVSQALIERRHVELKFKQTRIEGLNFETARLKRRRFGSSAESLDTSTQAVQVGAFLGDAALEDEAAKKAPRPAPAAPDAKGKSVRQALPAGLPRVDRHHDLGTTHCACGEAFKRIGE